MNSTNEINEYLIRLKNGERCIDDFFCAASGYIKLVAYKYLVDKSYVNDVVTTTFFRIFDNIQTFDESQSGKAWISKIAQNEAYSINNRERKHSYVPLEEVSEEIACTTDESGTLEFVAALQNAITKLDAIDRQIVELRVYEDMTYEEIAKMLDMYVGTVYKRFKSSVKKINDEIL